MHSVGERITTVRKSIGCDDSKQKRRQDNMKSVSQYEVERITTTQLQIYLDVCRDKYMRALIEPGKCLTILYLVIILMTYMYIRSICAQLNVSAGKNRPSYF